VFDYYTIEITPQRYSFPFTYEKDFAKLTLQNGGQGKKYH